MEKDKQIDYAEILRKHPWIVEKGQKYILSPDSDGFLCGLLVTNFLDSKVVGFYDGKMLLIDKNERPSDCIFLDMDINRKNIKSIGHHLVIYNNRLRPPNVNYNQCIQPNIMFNIDGKNDFQSKYPFATIHLLLGIFQAKKLITHLDDKAIWPLLFTDGTLGNLFEYTENCLFWLKRLRISEPEHLLHKFLYIDNFTLQKLMSDFDTFCRRRDEYNAKGYYRSGNYMVGGREVRTGDKMRLTYKNDLINLIPDGAVYHIHEKEKERLEGFISKMAEYTNWGYHTKKWCWNNIKLYRFKKCTIKNTQKRLNNTTYGKLMSENPLSLAMTSTTNIEYTLETPDNLD